MPPGGPFLPLTGGTVTGNILTHGNVEAWRASFGTQGGSPTLFDGSTPLYVANNPTYATHGGQSVQINGQYSGTITDSGQPQFNLFLGTDSVQAPNANSVAHVANYYNCSGTKGPRIAQQISFVVGNTTDGPSNFNWHQGLCLNAEANGTLGGTSTTYGGVIFGANFTSVATGNAKYLAGVAGLEVDVSMQPGSSSVTKGAYQATLQGNDAVESSEPSYAYSVGISPDSPLSNGWRRGLVFSGPNGWWPMNPTQGIMIYADPGVGSTGGPARTALSGIDFSHVTFSGQFLNSIGFSVDGTGLLTAAGGTMNGGLHFGSTTASGGPTDLSRHIELYGGGYAGFSVTPGSLNYISGSGHTIYCAGTNVASFDTNGLHVSAAISCNAGGINCNVGGLHFGSQNASAYNDFSKHIDLWGGGAGITVTSSGVNYVVSSAHLFYSGSSIIGYFNAGGLVVNTGALFIGGGAGPSWTTGSAAPASTQPVGSLYSRVGGAVGATLYVSRGGGTWAAVAGV
jgi:hypothetical protein